MDVRPGSAAGVPELDRPVADRRARTWDLFAAVAGLLVIAFFVASFFTPGTPTAENTTDVIAAELADDDAGHRVALFLGFLADIAFLVFLAGLWSRARWQQKTNVLPQEKRIVVDVVSGGDASTRPSTGELDALYSLYRNVHARNLELNVYPLPRRVLDAIADTPGWELLVMRAEAGGAPIGFVAVHTTASHVGPVFCGLDYDYVASHGVYQQVLWQSIRAAQRHGATRVMYGMAAQLHKRRFGAVPTKRWVYVQPTDTYNMDLLTHIAETVTRG